jgi:hypothetical protein
MFFDKQICIFAPEKQKGRVAEWLGNGLQNRALRFESARDLKQPGSIYIEPGFFIP